MAGFGSFQPICAMVPSYPWCNLYLSQLTKTNPTLLTQPDLSIAPVGVNISCGIARLGDGRLGNIANIIACFVSMVFVFFLIFRADRRKAAVGRVELNILLSLYLITLPLQILTTGSILEQASIPLVVLTAVHAGVVAALFWVLLGNAIVATQVVEDGTPASIVPLTIAAVAFFLITTYISLDTALSFTSVFKSSPPEELHGIAIFVITSIWPPATIVGYFAIMSYVVVHNLKEGRPLMFYGLSFILFILSQLAYFVLSPVLCRASLSVVDGSFIATLLETAAIGSLFLAWKSITEDSWEEGWYNA